MKISNNWGRSLATAWGTNREIGTVNSSGENKCVSSLISFEKLHKGNKQRTVLSPSPGFLQKQHNCCWQIQHANQGQIQKVPFAQVDETWQYLLGIIWAGWKGDSVCLKLKGIVLSDIFLGRKLMGTSRPCYSGFWRHLPFLVFGDSREREWVCSGFPVMVCSGMLRSIDGSKMFSRT